jgi:hypothetical protein
MAALIQFSFADENFAILLSKEERQELDIISIYLELPLYLAA